MDDPRNDSKDDAEDSLQRSRRRGIGLVLAGVFILFVVISAKARWQGASIQLIPASKPTDSMKLDLNAATEGQLMQLPGVGPSLAKRMVESRTSDGPFRSAESLSRVKGIGPKTIEQILPYVSTTTGNRPLP